MTSSTNSTNSRANEAAPQTIHGVFEQCAAQFGQRTATRLSGNDELTYTQLNQLANDLAAALQQRGVKPGDIVAMSFPHSAHWSVCMLAVLKCGAAYLPLDTNNPVARLQACLSTAKAKCILTNPAIASQTKTKDYAEGYDLLTFDLVPADSTKDSASDSTTNSRFAAQAMLQGEPVKPDPNVAQPLQPVEVNGDHLAYVMFTSGSTGNPKGVLVPHRAVVRLVVNTNYVDIQPSDAILQFAPPSFDASTFEFWGALLNGACLVPYSGMGLDPNRLKNDIEQNQVTVMWLTAALFHMVADKFIEALMPLRVLLAGGDVLNPKHVRKVLDTIPGVTLINGYGPTENTTFTCCHVMTAANPPEDKVPIGKAISGTDLHILDDEFTPVEPGHAGLLVAGGKGVALGYLSADPTLADLTPAAQTAFFERPELAPGLLYNTGDIVRAMPNGDIEFIGRKDNQVKVRGYRVSLEEIKGHLADLPGVSDAFVNVERHDGGDQILCAYVKSELPGTEAMLDAKTLRKALAGVIPAYMIPDKFVFCTELPINDNGKLDKARITDTHIN